MAPMLNAMLEANPRVLCNDEDIAHPGILAEYGSFEHLMPAQGDLPQNTYRLLMNFAATHPHRVVLEFPSNGSMPDEIRKYRYPDMAMEVTRAASLFRSVGVSRHDVVALLMPDRPELHWCYWGAEAAGIVMPIDPSKKPERIAALLRAAKARWLVTLGPGSTLWNVALDAVSKTSDLRGLLVVGVGGRHHPLTAFGLPVFDFHAHLSTQSGNALVFEPKPDDMACCICTGGTADAPRLEYRSHHAEVLDAWLMGHLTGQLFSQRTGFTRGLCQF